MNNVWKKEGKLFVKETSCEYMVVGYLIFTHAKSEECVYKPVLHKISKEEYSKEVINKIAQEMFQDACEEMPFAEKIVLLSAFIGECLDIEDRNGEAICFTFENNREAFYIEVEEKIENIIKDLNL